MLGDLHIRQEITIPNAKCWYSGSLVCQNIGEELNHGWLEWIYSNGWTIREHNIRNDNAPVKIRYSEIDKVEPSNPNYYTVITEKNETVDMKKLCEKFGKIPRNIITPKDVNFTLEVFDCKKIIQDFAGQDSDYLFELIGSTTTLIGDPYPRVRLKSLRFSNMYCYGPENYINFGFSNTGLKGLVAPNEYGKSSLFDIISFILIDKPSRGLKQDILRKGATDSSAELEFVADNNETYSIKKYLSSRGWRIEFYQNKKILRPRIMLRLRR